MNTVSAPNRWMKRFVSATITSLLVAILTPGVLAQGVRSLGMGGATPPISSWHRNPAFAGVPDASVPFHLPLPLGVLNVLWREEFDPYSEQFDLLTILDQMNHFGSFVLTPARSPDEIIVSVSEVNGVPTVSIDVQGGAPLQITEGRSSAFRHDFDLPISFGVGSLKVGVRPYLTADGKLLPGSGFEELFDEGTNQAAISGVLTGEAGVGINLSWAGPVPIPSQGVMPAGLFAGFRLEPYLGLARVDGAGTVVVKAEDDGSGDTEYSYSYDSNTFLAVFQQGGIGYGARGDLGLALTLPLPQGRVLAGISVHDLGIGFWNGQELTFSGDSSGATEGEPVAASRRYLFDDFSVGANASFELDPPAGPDLLIAADGTWRRGSIAAHLGAEGGFDAGPTRLLLRSGLGFDNGLVAGIGTGVRVVGIGLDAALHTYRSPFTEHQAFAVTAGLNFGF